MNILKHIFLSVAAILAATDISFAQTFANTPNDTFQISGMMEDQQTLIISQLNISSEIINLGWEKISESVPLSWEASVCDNRLCYSDLKDSGTMNPVAPAEMGFLLLHITGHVNYGTAVIRYAVWDRNNPALRDTLTYVMTIDKNTGIDETGSGKEFTVFPIPAVGYVNITSNSQTGFSYSIITVNGMEIETGLSEANSLSILTENYPNGIYFLKIKSDNTIYTQKIIKQ